MAKAKKPKKDKKTSKRVTVYARDLNPYLELVSEELAKNAIKIKKLADEFDPPYPFLTVRESRDNYHLASLALIVYSCLKKMVNDFGEAELLETIDSCVVEYQELPSRNSGIYGDSQPGIEDTTFTKEMLDMSTKIADWLIASKIKISYIKRGGVTSDKIMGSLAIIYTGRVLQKRKLTLNAPSQPDIN